MIKLNVQPYLALSRIFRALILASLFATPAAFAESKASPEALKISAEDFRCMLDMTPVRGFFVDNLIEGKLEDTLKVANAEQGQYPPGSVVQLVPTEVMVKHPKGYNAATKDWEFFELTVSEEGSEIHKRGFVDVVNRFDGNCFACHIKAKPEFDLICETGHGCDPLPIGAEVFTLLQKTDARCGGRYTPTPEEIEILKKLSASS
ncbi:hypothetical protein [Pseudomaricurvus sp.]|uniref:hypothetical protein n=1 Tax=Pseudomaricurvus sp. TaxID=2004510 RepID=UPI003F6AD23D